MSRSAGLLIGLLASLLAGAVWAQPAADATLVADRAGAVAPDAPGRAAVGVCDEDVGGEIAEGCRRPPLRQVGGARAGP